MSNIPGRGRPPNRALSDLSRALQCGRVRDLLPPLNRLRREDPAALDALITRATGWRKTDPQARAVDLAYWSVLNESLARVIASEMLGGSEGLAVSELAELTAARVAGLVACGGPGEAQCAGYSEFEALVRATAVAILLGN